MLIPVQASGRVFEEMHVDGSTSASILFAPEMVAILPDELKPLHGANVYLVINGHLRSKAISTSIRTLPILERSVDTALNSDARARVELVYSFAQRHQMHLEVTEIPTSYALGGFVSDLQPSRMKALFQYGKRCATEGRVWGHPFDVLNRLAALPRAPSRDDAPCPAPGASLTSKAGR